MGRACVSASGNVLAAGGVDVDGTPWDRVGMAVSSMCVTEIQDKAATHKPDTAHDMTPTTPIPPEERKEGLPGSRAS